MDALRISPAEARSRPVDLQDVRSGLDLDDPSLEVPTDHPNWTRRSPEERERAAVLVYEVFHVSVRQERCGYSGRRQLNGPNPTEVL